MSVSFDLLHTFRLCRPSGDLLAYLPDRIQHVSPLESSTRRSCELRNHPTSKKGHSAQITIKAIRSANTVRYGECRKGV